MKKEKLIDLKEDQVVHIYPLHGPEHVFCSELTCWCLPNRVANDKQIILHRDLN